MIIGAFLIVCDSILQVWVPITLISVHYVCQVLNDS